MDNVIDVCSQAVEQFGVELQSLVICEELAELIQAVSKFRRNKNIANVNNLLEEVADVEICIAQIKVILQKELPLHSVAHSEKIIENIKSSKINRLKNRLG